MNHYNAPSTHTTPIKVAQLNVQRNKSTVITLLNEHTDLFDVVLIQEPLRFKIGTDDGKEVYGSVHLQGWIPILPSTSSEPPRPRTITYVKKRPDFSITLRTDIVEDPDIQVLDVSQSGHPTTTIIIYTMTPHPSMALSSSESATSTSL
jgi:hypothetical protein